ncbi:MAG: pyridoxal 5'-phosphate synthase glutaminase subunit PdxT [Candidatus Micrarchaeota archaeon]
MNPIRIGILSFQGGVVEHIHTTEKAANELKIKCEVVPVKHKKDFEGLDGLIIPGGESTTLWKLIEREGIAEEIKKVHAIFGTCAGAIMLAKQVKGLIEGQQTLELMDIEADRNAYGPQTESFETKIEAKLDGKKIKAHAVFIRAPKIKTIGKKVKAIAELNGELIVAEEKSGNKYYLVATFHPELTKDTLFHRHFLKQIV